MKPSNILSALVRIVSLAGHLLSSFVGRNRRAVYARHSLRDPAPESIARQEALCRALAARLNPAGPQP